MFEIHSESTLEFLKGNEQVRNPDGKKNLDLGGS